MLKVLIADDENWICELIKNLIDWPSLDFEVVYQASNGMDAFENIIKYEPHLVITDIRMPVLDGIGLIQKTVEVLPATHFIVISGYHDFDYAQQAIRLGVSDYILKPIDEDELLASIIKIKDKILNFTNHADLDLQLARKKANAMEYPSVQFLEDLLHNRAEPVQSIELINKTYELALIGEENKVVLFKLDSPISFDESGLDALIIQKMRDILEKRFKSIPGFCCYSSGNLIISIVNLKLSPLIVSESILSSFADMREYACSLGNFQVTAGVGSTAGTLGTLYKSYEAARLAIQSRMMTGADRIITSESLNFKTPSLRDLFPVQAQNRLRSACAIFNGTDAASQIKELLAPFASNQLSAGSLFSLAQRILDLLFDLLHDNDLIQYAVYPKATMLAMLDDCLSVPQFDGMLSGFVQQTLARCYDSLRKEINSPVEAAKAYVAINFSKPLSLEEVALNVHLNATYFSELFKRITGENFWDYLVNYRMLMAQEFLKNNENKIHEVAILVGYNDSRHFSKLFKKIVGITPKEYRDLLA